MLLGLHLNGSYVSICKRLVSKTQRITNTLIIYKFTFFSLVCWNGRLSITVLFCNFWTGEFKTFLEAAI